ncbi:MAG: hypothetical protein JWP27_1635 [Flaviaesturariibacter sp.]|nr:hypothetical protein [Flaviaesturariibacter sp.]
MKTNPSLLFIPLLFFIFLSSCKKSGSEAGATAATGASSQTVMAWLASKKANATPNRNATIDLLTQCLDLTAAHTEQLGSGDRFLVIPVTQQFLKEKRLAPNALLTLLLVLDPDGGIKRGSLVRFDPAAGTAGPLDRETFPKLFASRPLDRDGLFTFMNVSGSLRYKLGYRDGKIYSLGKPARRQPGPGVSRAATCYEWYLDTDYYISGVLVDHTSVYLGLHCFNETGGGGGNYGCDDPWIESICPDDGTGGGGGSVDCCIPDASFQLTSEMQSQVKEDYCGPASIDPATGLLTKTCTHSWYFNRSYFLWYDWHYYSTETTKNELDGSWKFKSVEHTGTGYDGTQPFCLSVTEHVAGIVISLSTDRRTASVRFQFSLHATVPCIPGYTPPPAGGVGQNSWTAV